MAVIRVVVSDPGTDGPARSAADAAARALRDAGMEVVRTRDGSAAALARTAVQEDADAVCLPDAALAAEVRAELAAEAAHVLVLSGPPESLAARIRDGSGA